MKYIFKASETFWRKFYSLSDSQKQSTRAAWELFKRDPFDPRLGTHKINRLSAASGHTVYSVVIEGDLRSLFETPLEGCYAVAVKQMNIAELPPMEGGGTPQFYSGVLVLDTARMREENIREKLFDAIQDLGVGCHDQVAFNLVFGSQVKLVNPTYNYCNVNDMLCSPDEACRHYGLGLDEWKRAQRNPVILHFIDGKPWNQRFCLRERAWVRAFRKSPYADISLKRKTSMKVLLIWMLNALLPAGIGRSTLRRLFVRFFKKDW